jgi:hypothetical protein
MHLASSRSFVSTVLLAALAGCSSTEPGAMAPDVPLPEANDWVVEVYKPIQEQAEKMSVDEFLAEYPTPDYVSKVTYDPSSAAFMAEISEYAGLTDKHDELLQKNGFVAVGDKSETHTFATTYLDLYFNDLPVFISADSLLYALHQSFDAMLKDFELVVLVPEVGRMLQLMHEELGESHASLPESLQPSVRDLDIYLAVARSLLDDFPVAPVTGVEPAEIQRILDAAAAAQARRPQPVRRRHPLRLLADGAPRPLRGRPGAPALLPGDDLARPHRHGHGHLR